MDTEKKYQQLGLFDETILVAMQTTKYAPGSNQEWETFLEATKNETIDTYSDLQLKSTQYVKRKKPAKQRNR